MTETEPPAGEIANVVELVDALEEAVGGGRRLPFTPSVVVNEEEVLELVDRIRLALPDDLVTARHTVEERDQMLERASRDAAEAITRADEEARRIVGEAQAQAAALVDEHAIVRAATQRAESTVAEADQHAASQRSAADDYAREVMQRLEDQLERWLATVREGMQALPEAPRPQRRRGR